VVVQIKRVELSDLGQLSYDFLLTCLTTRVFINFPVGLPLPWGILVQIA